MYGGAVMSCSVPMRAWVEIVPAAQLTLEAGGEAVVIRGLDDLRPRGDRFDLPRAVFRYFKLPQMAAHITFGSDIPMQSGLAGSTALLVAMTQRRVYLVGHSGRTAIRSRRRPASSSCTIWRWCVAIRMRT
jgi:galactokinase/mevalonate kinase-like predicted kinase